MVFSFYIPASTILTFNPAKQATLCAALTAGWNAPSSNVTCTIGSVTGFNGTDVLVSGYAYFGWTVTPSITALNTATNQRDTRVLALNTNVASVLGTSFPGAVPNCACNGMDLVTASGAFAFSYTTNIIGVPLMQCGARLTYNSALATGIINQVGVDDGSTNFGNLGKFCSTPAVQGGVTGIPGMFIKNSP